MIVLINDSAIEIKTLTFPGGELHIELVNLPEKELKPIYIRSNVHSSDDLMTLILTINALQNHYGESVRIALEIPYFPYARQDRVCAVGQAFSLQLVAKIIRGLHLNSLTVWDAHSPVTHQLTGAISIPQEQIIASNQHLVELIQDENSVLVCPDKGAKGKCKKVKDVFSVKRMIFSEKVREPSTGKIVDTRLVSGDLSGKTAIIIDDICDGGRTFIEIAKKLKKYNVNRVILYVTHGIFSKGLEVFDDLIDEIFTTNSFPQTENPKLTVIDFVMSQSNLTQSRNAKQ